MPIWYLSAFGTCIPRTIAAMTPAFRPQPLRSVSDTALLVAYHRAMETRRPDALFHDEFAVRVSEGRGEEIARRLPFGRLAWSTIVRTVLVDEVVLRLVSQGVETVINLAAGLDARPYRLPLPPSLRWIEVDLPDMIREKSEALANETPHCRIERIALDLSEAGPRRELFARLGAESSNALVLSEGLLVYLAPQVVGELAEDLHAVGSFRHWAIDLATPIIRKRVNRWWGKKLQRANTKYQFAPEEGTKFFEPHGWHEAEFCELFEHSIRLNRTVRGFWMFKLYSKLMPRRTARMREKWRAGVVLLEP
jgi:methyltransferase (TIGR00027 family)